MFKNVGVVIKAFNNPSDSEIDSVVLLMSTLCKHFSNVYINEQNINFPRDLDIIAGVIVLILMFEASFLRTGIKPSMCVL